MDTGNMRINSIGVNYSGNYAQKNKRIVTQQTPVFQANKGCARFFSISLGGIGTIGAAGLLSALSQAISDVDIAAFSAIVGSVFAAFGYDEGQNLDKIIEDGKKNIDNFEKTHGLSDKK